MSKSCGEGCGYAHCAHNGGPALASSKIQTGSTNQNIKIIENIVLVT